MVCPQGLDAQSNGFGRIAGHHPAHVSCAPVCKGCLLPQLASRRADTRRLSRHRFLLAAVNLAALCASPHVAADPWLAPGDAGLRHDLLLLADEGIIRGPISTWPLSWPDIARDVGGAGDRASDDTGVQAALLRVQRRARAAASTGYSGVELAAELAEKPIVLRAFADTPREEGELELRASWLGSRFAANMQAQLVASPVDERELRLDGSYLGVNLGNFMISAGAMERWWGPGNEGSLIVSNNARPIPAITVERNYTDAFKSRWLAWIGPWRASIAIGEAEGSNVGVPDTRFFAARVNFRPRPWLELGLSRTAQWCGEGRPCGFDTFGDLLLGRDNRSDSLTIDDEPGNQMAGYDLRIRSPWRAIPIAVYAQYIGEDEAGGLPSKFLGLVGGEFWGNTRWGAYRVHAEYADTACSFSRSEPEFNCAYRNGLYPQGYTYRGRVIGHAMDQDGRMYSLGGTLVRPKGDVITALVRTTDLNRDGGGNFVSAVPAEINNLEVSYERDFWRGRFVVGLGYDDASALGASNSDVRGFLSWRQPL